MAEVRKIGRRTWLRRSASGALAVWAALTFDSGREGWGVLLGVPSPRPAAAQEAPAVRRILLEFPAPPDNPFGATTLDVSAYLVIRGGEAALVDTLVEGNGARIAESVQAAGLGWDAVRHVILTHWHPDHVGSAPEVLEMATQATVWAGEADIPRITLPREIQPLADGDEVFGLQIIHTPGHTDGHVSVLDPVGSTLIAGDAVVNVGGNLAGSPPPFTANMEQAIASVAKLGSLSFERAFFGHGVPLESGASAAIAALAASLRPAAPAAPQPQQPAVQQPAVQVPG